MGGGKGEAVRTQLGQTDTVHCLHFRRGGGRAVAPSRLYLFKLKYTLLLSLWHIICLVSWSALLSLRFIAFEGSQDWRIQFFLHFFSLHSAAGTTATPSRVVKVKICHVKGVLGCQSVIKCSVLLHFHLFVKAKSLGSEDKKSLVRFKPTSQTNCHVLLPTQLSSHAVKVILKPLLLEMILGLGLN